MNFSEQKTFDRGLPKEDCTACQQHVCMQIPHAFHADFQKFRRLKRGDRLSCANRNGTCIWVVLSGVIAICASLADGRRQIIGFEFSGDFLCGSSSSNCQESRIEALTECEICEITIPVDAEPILASPALVTAMFQQVHQRLERSATHVTALGRLDSMERICLFLLEMANRMGGQKGKALKAELSMSREDIADYLGLNTETVSRVMSRVKRMGLAVFLSPTTYVIPDVSALERRIPVSVRLDPPQSADQSEGRRCPI